MFENLSNAIKEANKKKEEALEKKLVAQKELRHQAAPGIKKLADQYGASVTWLDTDAYVYITGENGKERGIYIPYGTSETAIDLKLDALVYNIGSASKHKSHSFLEKIADTADKIEEGYKNQDRDIAKLESSSPVKKQRNFWDNPPTLSDLDTSLNKKR